MCGKIKILIVEDEFMIAEDIRGRLEDMGYDVVGMATSYEEGIDFLKQNPVDLAMLDICINGKKDGIDLAAVIQEKYNIPFIFLSSQTNSAHVERAKTVHPSAYLLKPFNDRQVQISIELAMDNFNKNEFAVNQANESALQPPTTTKFVGQDQCLFMRKESHFVRVNFDDILWFQAEDNYTLVQTTDDRFVYSMVLKQFENKLPESQFMRVHRSYIVNMAKVTGFDGGMIHVGNSKIPISRNTRDELLKNYNII
jgi:DNA-binding LytR/AlgR family response regulator